MRQCWFWVALLVCVEACGGGGDDEGDEEPAGTITVHGVTSTVGTTVTAWSAGGAPPVSTMTGEDGTYRIKGVKAPYDLLYGDTDLIVGSSATVHDFGPQYVPPENVPATVSVGLQINPDSKDYFVPSFLECPDVTLTTVVGEVISLLSYGYAFPTAQTCTAAALAVQRDGRGYGGFGTASIDITPGQEVVVGKVDLTQPITSHEISFAFPDGATALYGLCWARGSYVSTVEMSFDPVSTFTVSVPDDGNLEISAIAGQGEGLNGARWVAYRRLSADQDATDIAVPDVAIVSGITDNAADVDTSVTITVNATDAAVFVYSFNDTLSVTTSSSELPLSRLDDYGVGLAPVTSYDLQVTAYSAGTVDDTSRARLVREKTAFEIVSPHIHFTTR